MPVHDVDAARGRLSSGDLSAQELADIAAAFPSLRPLVAAHPHAYPTLIDWLAGLGDPAVDAALAARAAAAPPTPAGPPVEFVTSSGAQPAHRPSAPAGADGPVAGVPTDPVSIAALVTGVLGLGPVPLALGVVALHRTRRNGTGGRGLAIAGIVLGSLVTLLGLTGAGLAIWTLHGLGPTNHGIGDVNAAASTPAAAGTWFQYEDAGHQPAGQGVATAADVFRSRLAGTPADVTVRGTTIRLDFASRPSAAVLAGLTVPTAVEFRPVLLLGDPSPAPTSGTAAGPPVDRAPGPSSPSDAGYYVTADVVAQFDRLDCTGDVPAATGPQDQALVACARDGSAKYVLGPVELTGDHLAGVSASLQSQNWVDSMAFDGQGTIQLAQTTTRLASLPSPGNQLALLVDGRIETAPAVHEVIPEGKLLLSGSPTQDSAYALAASLGFGRGDNTWTLTSSGS